MAHSRTAPTPPLRIAFVGAGKVGCSLARYLTDKAGGTGSHVPPGAAAGSDVEPSVTLAGFASSRRGAAEEAAAFAGGIVFAGPVQAARAADVLFITTPDGQIGAVWEELAEAARAGRVDLAGKIVAHCSGALPSSVLAGAAELGALPCSLHPLYAVSSRFECWRELARCWFALEGDQRACAALAGILAARGNRCARIAAAQKTRYHAAAVMASNLVVGLYARAAAELARCGLAYADAEAALAPLFIGNAEHIAHDGVAAALTGPAARGDTATIEAHLACLDGDDAEIYRALTRVLYDIASEQQGSERTGTEGASEPAR